MSEFSVHDKQSAPEAAQQTMEMVEKGFGFIPNVIGVMAESPELAKAYATLDGLLGETDLGKEERNILLLVTARVNQCEYCVAAHTAGANMEGVSEEIVSAIRNDQPIEDGKLEAFRRFVAEMTEKRGFPSDEATAEFLKAGYSRKNLLEVILGIGLKTLSNYTNHVAETPLDSAFQPAEWQPPK